MTFFESIKTVFRKYAEFEGRATRPEFWWFALFSFLVAAMLSVLTPAQSGMWGWSQSAMLTSVGMGAGLVNLSGAWSIAVLLPSLAVAVRRLRDTGRTWHHVLWILLPFAGAIVLIVFLSEPTKTVADATAPAAN